MRKIVVVGSDEMYAIETFYVKYLRKIGIEVHLYPSSRKFGDYYNQSVLNKLRFKLNLSGIYKRLNNELLYYIKGVSPDIVWIFKGMEIFPDTLIEIKKTGIKLVNYNPDNPFRFSGRGSGNRNITKSISLYDLHFTYNLEVKCELESLNANVKWLPFGFDLEECMFQNCLHQEEAMSVCFLGNPDKYRASFVKSISESGILVHVYGHQWSRYAKHENVVIHEAVFGEEFWRVAARYRVQLNLMRPHNFGSHNMRTFEVPAVGGIMVAPDTREHRMFFDDGKEIFLYKDLSSCVSQIKRLLEIGPEQAFGIRLNARRRSLQSGYSYSLRAAEAWNFMMEL